MWVTQQKIGQKWAGGRASKQVREWVSSNRFIESPCGRPEWTKSTNQRMMQDGWCVDRKHFFILFYPIATNHDGWLAMYQHIHMQLPT
jgi:hypothetical protein